MGWLLSLPTTCGDDVVRAKADATAGLQQVRMSTHAKVRNVSPHRLLEARVTNEGELAHTDIELAVDKATSVHNWNGHAVVHLEARPLQRTMHPLTGVLAVAAMPCQQDACIS